MAFKDACRASTSSSSSVAPTSSSVQGFPQVPLPVCSRASAEALGGPAGGGAPGAGYLASSAGHQPDGCDAPAASPRGLVGLAALLGKSPEERHALDAVLGALDQHGISVPEDLALIGDGDELPAGIIAEIQGGCDTSGFEEALLSMFRASRGGLCTNLDLLAMRIRRANTPASLAVPSGPSDAGTRAAKRLNQALAGGTAKVTKIVSDEGGESLATQEDAKMQAALERCFGLLEAIGERSPRWVLVFATNKISAQASRSLQQNAFRAKFRNPSGLDAARRRFEVYIKTFLSMDKDPYVPEEWDVAAFISDQLHRGQRGPSSMFHALVWATGAFGLDLQLQSTLVLAQKSGWMAAKEVQERKPARMATPDMLRSMETAVTSPSATTFWVCWAGVFAALGHGCLRWSDLQHSRDVSLTDDAVFGSTWRMKGKHRVTHWAALRVGLSGEDWGRAWLEALRSQNLPGSDFVISAPASSWASFRSRPADFYDAQAAMRVLLVRSGMDKAEAMTYSCHSWRHLYPTAGRQLDMDPKLIETLGHWAPGSGMAALYDSRACVAELTQKDKVRKAFAAGWDLVDPGCVPRQVPGPEPQVLRQRDAPASSSAPSASRNPANITVPDMYVFMVVNRRLHGYKEGPYTVCRRWRCGSPGSPSSERVLFVPPEQAGQVHGELCRICFKMGMTNPIPNPSASPPCSPSRSSSSCSSSSSSS